MKRKINRFLYAIAAVIILMVLSLPTCSSQAFLGSLRSTANVGTIVEANSDEVDAFLGVGFTHRGVVDLTLLVGQDFSINEKVVGLQVAALILPTKIVNVVGNAYAQHDEHARYRAGITLNHNFTNKDCRAFSPFAGGAFRRDGRNDQSEWVWDLGMSLQLNRWVLEARYSKDFMLKVNYLIHQLK